MSEYQRKLENKLWAIADELRGNMDANEFKNYMLGFIFYKYLSEKIEIYLNQELKEDGVTFKQAFEDQELKEEVEAEAIDNLGYFLEPRCLFKNLIKKAKNGEFILDNLQMAMNQIENSTMGHESEEDFENLFEDVDLQSSKLGKSEDAKNKLISKVLLHLADIDFKMEDTEQDILGDAYEYLISQFASSAGKKAGVIRKYLVKEKNYLDAVIGLPANIFYGTSIPTVILVFKKCREDDTDILFIDASILLIINMFVK